MYSLVGVDGNAFSIMGYTANAMKRCGLRDEIDKMMEDAISSDYYHLIYVCNNFVEKCNAIISGGNADV